MLKKLLVFTSLAFSLNANSAIVSYNGYSLNTDTKIVTGGGLEWLQWSETNAQSANTALANYAQDGWRMATESEVANLFNSFDFGLTFYATNATNIKQEIRTPYSSTEDSNTNNFITLFGENSNCLGCQNVVPGTFHRTRARYGVDFNRDNTFSIASITDDYLSTSYPLNVQGIVSIETTTSGENSFSGGTGIALVRISEVPLPAMTYLFFATLISMLIFKQKTTIGKTA